MANSRGSQLLVFYNWRLDEVIYIYITGFYHLLCILDHDVTSRNLVTEPDVTFLSQKYQLNQKNYL